MMRQFTIIMALEKDGTQFPSPPLYDDLTIADYRVALLICRVPPLYQIKVTPKPLNAAGLVPAGGAI
jgi:hypothetical protein